MMGAKKINVEQRDNPRKLILVLHSKGKTYRFGSGYIVNQSGLSLPLTLFQVKFLQFVIIFLLFVDYELDLHLPQNILCQKHVYFPIGIEKKTRMNLLMGHGNSKS